MRGLAPRVLGYLAPHRFRLGGALGLLLLTTACELLKPWPLKIVIDSVLGGQPVPGGWGAGWPTGALLLAACAALVLIYVLLGVLAVQSNVTTIRIGQRMVSDLRDDLYGHLHRLSLSFHSRARIGDLLYRVTSDTFALQTLTMNCILPAVSALLLLGGMTVIMVRLDPGLTALALAVVPALLLAIARVDTRVGRAAGLARERESEVYAEVQRSMSAVRVIQAFTREEDEHRRFMARSGESLAASLTLYRLQTVYSAVVSAVIAVGTAAVVWVGARHVLDGTLSVGALVVFVSYLASLYGPINSLFQTWGLAHSARAGVRRVFDLLDVERDIVDGPHDAPPAGVRGEVAWEGVWFGYAPDRPVLRGVSLRVPAGQTVAIVGPTGVGKSTLLGLLPRFHDASAGRVTLDGRDVRDYKLAALRRQVAMVLQPPLVLPATIADNIAFGRPGATRDEVVAAARLARIHDAIAALPAGYDTPVGEHGVTLSEGEKQRLTIARAILRDSPVLVLDEPTSSLDAETEALIVQGLERLTAGRTVFIIAHRLSTIRRADRIVVLRHGRIAEEGSFQELLDRGGAFAALYRLQREPEPDGRAPLAIP